MLLQEHSSCLCRGENGKPFCLPELWPWTNTRRGSKIGTLRYSGRGRGGRQPEVKCSILGIISIMPERRPEVATVKTRCLAASLNGELVFLFWVQKLLFVKDFRSVSLQETHLSVFSVVFSRDWLLFFCYLAFWVQCFGGNWEWKRRVFRHKCNT